MSLVPKLAIVAPCYNEEAALKDSLDKLHIKIEELIAKGKIAESSYLLVVDDGSRDASFNMLQSAVGKKMKVLKLAGNVGHQRALLAGMHWVTEKCDVMISLDIDLQDDLDTLDRMLEEYAKGNEIVYGVRDNRDADSWFKKNSALLFYRLMKTMGVGLIYNHADFRLLSNTALREFGRYHEVNLFLRGIFPMMGFPNAKVFYQRQERTAGESKYPFRKMLHLAMDGITSFSNRPLKWISLIGLIIFIISLILSGWVLWVVVTGRSVPGWASITLPIYFIGGIQLLSLGIIGEYISKIYLESKQRPQYHIEKVLE
jgi:glycosyltransferase involved in cell wall biosynthesis